MNHKVMFSSANDNYKTPDKIYKKLNEEFHFDFDPCPLDEDPKFDGLNIEWGKCSFVNPPYSNIKAWVKKAHEESKKYKRVVMLIPSRTDTRWWHDYVMKATEIRFIKGRLKFNNCKWNAPFPSCIVYFNGFQYYLGETSEWKMK